MDAPRVSGKDNDIVRHMQGTLRGSEAPWAARGRTPGQGWSWCPDYSAPLGTWLFLTSPQGPAGGEGRCLAPWPRVAGSNRGGSS